jgi:hypothetical protein
VSDLAKMVDKMDHSRGASEIDASALDIEFHRTLWRHSGNEYLAKMLESITIPLFANRVLWRLNREMLGWASILPNSHRLLLEFVEGKIDRPAEEVMLEHLSYRYDHPERFSSLALPQDIARGTKPRYHYYYLLLMAWTEVGLTHQFAAQHLLLRGRRGEVTLITFSTMF